MRVSFDSGTYVVNGYDEEGLPKIKKVNSKRVEGTVVATVVMTRKDIVGDKEYQSPYFVVALDDGRFTDVNIRYCTKVSD